MIFPEKIVVVTGGSKGFGKALASALVKEGATVTITGIESAEVASTANEIGAEYITADASSFDEMSKVVEHVVARFGRIDIWVNNAGIQIAPSNIEEVALTQLHRLFNVNFFGYFYGCKAVLPIMKRQNSGLIINVNSTAGLSGKSGLSAYVSSKFAIKGLSETIRTELEGTSVSLYQIFPGGMQTDIYHEKVPADIKAYMQVDYVIDKVMANLKQETPAVDLVIKRPAAG